MSTTEDSPRDYYAHSLEGKSVDFWEPLPEHLKQVAELAAQFASKFGANEWGYLAGLLHDIGKYNPRFQTYIGVPNGFEAHLEHQPGRIDHSTAGAKLANKLYPRAGWIIPFCIAGHHAGLANAIGDDSLLGRSDLKRRLENPEIDLDTLPIPNFYRELRPLPFPTLKPLERCSGFPVAFFTRMLFSCLVDADFLSTESFMSPDRAKDRPKVTATFENLESIVQQYLRDLQQDAKPTKVNDVRRGIVEACYAAAGQSPGFFSLTVPTGGGKTLSSLLFAMRHANKHGHDRVIMAIPFTSIIEQTADVYRNVFKELGEEIVLEHHSNFDPKKETATSRLATENWDSPLVVTTNVQLLESLFANKTSRCRKLHRIANSVIILDEAQTLSVDLLSPTLAALRELVTNYGCTIVLCTATQPAINLSEDFTIGLDNVREIIPNPTELYEQLKRVEVTRLPKLSDEELITQLAENEKVLCIVNTRQHAAELYALLKSEFGTHEGLYHLSANMCPEHRTDILKKIKAALLIDGQPCRVISTQLIEAGVDVDFPVVYRAMAGLDSLAQSAGRCNREGKLEQPGQVYVFEPAEVPPPPFAKGPVQSAEAVWRTFPDDILSLEAMREYFSELYWKKKKRWDKEKIMEECFVMQKNMLFQFKDAAARFQMIPDSNQVELIVPWGKEGKALCNKLMSEQELTYEEKRRLQRYSVSVSRYRHEDLLSNFVQVYLDRYPVLLQESKYSKEFGIDERGFNPHDYIP